jgi:hypothetical protein
VSGSLRIVGWPVSNKLEWTWKETVIFQECQATTEQLGKHVSGGYLKPRPLKYAAVCLPSLDRDIDGTDGNLHDQLRKYQLAVLLRVLTFDTVTRLVYPDVSKGTSHP